MYSDAAGVLDNPMINPMAPSLTHQGSKMLVAVAGKDSLHFKDRKML